MQQDIIQSVMTNACASVEMEGFEVSEQMKAFCAELLSQHIDWSTYMENVKKMIGVSVQ